MQVDIKRLLEMSLLDVDEIILTPPRYPGLAPIKFSMYDVDIIKYELVENPF